MRRAAVIVVALLSIAGLLWWSAAHSERHTETAEPIDESPPASAPLPAQPPEAAAPAGAPAPSAATAAAPSPDPSVREQPSTPPPAAAPSPGALQPPQTVGPVAALEQRFNSESRDASAPKLERTIENAFKDKNVARELLKSAQCHKSVCKLVLRWSAERSQGYMLVLMNLRNEFSPELAIQPLGRFDAKGVMPVDVYWGRIAAGARTP